VKILDFGLAKMKLLDVPQSMSLTTPGAVVGTLHYMSPEQIVGGDVDERTDIFAIGVMLLESLTGRQPFTGNSPTEVALSIIQKPFQLQGDSAEVRQLNLMLQKCIAKNREHRFSSVAEMQKDLIEAIRNCPPFPAPNQAQRDSNRTTSGTTVL
jgi:serine/threonine-protein kinase